MPALHAAIHIAVVNLFNADKRINGIQIEDHEIKIVNFADNNTTFLRDITSFNRVQVILKLYENVKINYLNENLAKKSFFKKPLNELVHIKIERINQDNWNSHIFH